MDRIPTALIGYGLAGRVFHAPFIQATEALNLVAISTTRAVPPGIRTARVEELLADPDIALVVIASPNDSHFPLAKAALAAGKHVVVDKPMCVTSAQGDELIATARRAGRLLSVFHNRRWDCDFLTVRKLLAAGTLGRIALAQLHWDRFRPQVADRWRDRPVAGAGLLFDLGPHLVDQALLLFGRPESISADLAAQRDGAAVDDYFDLTLHYADKAVRLAAASLIAERRPRFALYGTQGSFVKPGLDPQEDQLVSGATPLDPGFGSEDPALHGTLTLADGTGRSLPGERGEWLAYYRALADAIESGGAAPVDAADAVAGLKIIELARHSAADGRRLPLT